MDFRVILLSDSGYECVIYLNKQQTCLCMIVYSVLLDLKYVILDCIIQSIYILQVCVYWLVHMGPTASKFV